MSKFVITIGKFVAVLNVCAVACVFIWERFVAGTIYHCTDPGFLDFLSPGHWGHAPQHGDTIRAGWSMTGLWWLWYSFVIASAIVSLAFAMLPWRFGLSREHVTHNAA
jgi:hypothetical protein